MLISNHPLLNLIFMLNLKIVPLPKVTTLACQQMNGFPTTWIISWAPFFLKVSILSAQNVLQTWICNLGHGSTSVNYQHR